ncbi:unnamed protein product [Bursaphelenchus okinawaensis]|uniref:Delta(3,5)-Delta(2,4)-dienoyl-CoA isomerase, mitochondrial n=1 Tax=Bursaphelenchus okinawaensis TaxID=465554 RepID=A0A811K6G0_9BILA|nr:unnamed protein product [Bursaphelenchus okinawaensis]CAG9092489.1 unnamed protein product [Bursaphelenchus okinawaensis]
MDNYKFLRVVRSDDNVTQVILNRPKQLNSLNRGLWREIGDVFKQLDEDDHTKVIVFHGEGKLFCAGLDIKERQQENVFDTSKDGARFGQQLLRDVTWLQEAFSNIEKCQKPVIASVHSACLGGGISLITACDIIYCSKEAVFSIKEVQLGLIADVGALNRMPFMVGNMSWLKDVALTGRNFDSNEALQFGLVSRVFNSREETLQAALNTASDIAQLSPISVQGTKMTLNYSREHTVAESLKFVALLNMSQTQNDDLKNNIMMFKKAKL